MYTSTFGTYFRKGFFMPEVTFRFEEGDKVKVDASISEELLEVARKANVVIDAPCSGNASCGKCKVKLVGGSLKSEMTRHISEEEYQEGWRLACISTVIEDVEILVPDIASAYRSRMKVADLSSREEVLIFNQAKRDILGAGFTFENPYSFVELTLSEPTLDDTMPDNERLIRAYQIKTGVKRAELAFSALKKLPDFLRKNNFRFFCVVRKTETFDHILDILASNKTPVVGGLAIDIGTTTVSAILVDLTNGYILAKASAGNGQIRYGADVINRIIESSKEGGRKRLQKAVIDETLRPLILSMCNTARITEESIYHICIASNTTMNHLLVGVDAEPVRMEPYIPAFFTTSPIPAMELSIPANSNADIVLAPNIGSYVGGDITAGTISSMIWNKEEMSLFIDLGTNGELVLGNSDFLFSCACSAGPAFEGGDISCGMRATDGAIEACTIDIESMEPFCSIIGDKGQKPVGICGSGIIDIISELFRCGIINPKGKFIREGDRVKRDEFGIGRYILANKEESGTVKEVVLNEVDIDNFIRAKGAIFSAICTMMNSQGFDMGMIDHVYVAGGIGSGINMEAAIGIGMLPDIPLDKFSYIGNSSLSGAYAILLSSGIEKKVHEIAANMTYMELSTDPSYMDEFVAACFLPHTNETLFPSVFKKLK